MFKNKEAVERMIMFNNKEVVMKSDIWAMVDLQQLNEFYNYCLDVYDSTCGGFYWNEKVPMSMQEIKTAYLRYRITYPELNHLDTTTRQACKDFVVAARTRS